MVERSFTEPIWVADIEPALIPKMKPKWAKRDFWLVLTGVSLGVIVSSVAIFGLYLILEMGL